MANIMHKYRKYMQKNKLLIKQTGGTRLTELQDKITYVTPHCLDGDMFHQHIGECVNDSIQMIFCFCDGIKESAQRKLLNLTPAEIIEMAYLTGREKYLAPYYRRDATDEQQNKIAIKMETRLMKYLHFLQTRLCSHLDKYGIPYCNALPPGTSDLTCSKYDKYDIVIDEPTGLESDHVVLKRRLSTVSGIGAAMKFGKLVNMTDHSLYEHGAPIFADVIFINILSFCLLNGNDAIISDMYKINEIDISEIDDVTAIICNMQKKNSSTNASVHAVCFYICNGVEMFFDNEYGNIEFSWKNMLKYYVERSDTHKLFHCYTKSTNAYTFILKNNDDDSVIVWNPNGTIENTTYTEYETTTQYIFWNLITVQKRRINDDEIDTMLKDDFLRAAISHSSLENVDIDLIMANEFERDSFIYIVLGNLKNKVCEESFVKTIIGREEFVSISAEHKEMFIEYMFFREDNNSGYNLELLQLLLEKGAKIPTKLENGYTPLEYALYNINLDLVKLLIEYRVGINDIFSDEDTYPIDHVLQNLQYDASDPTHNAENRMFFGNVFDLLISNGVELDSHCLKMSLYTNNVDIVDAILDVGGVDVNAIIDKKNHYTALFYVAINFRQISNFVKIINTLINHGADVNHVDAAGNTIMAHILGNMMDSADIVTNLLTSKSVDVNATYKNTGESIESMLLKLGWAHD
jgi:hypothetical protein